MKKQPKKPTYDYIGFETKTANKFKKIKPKGTTNTEFLEELLKNK